MADQGVRPWTMGLSHEQRSNGSCVPCHGPPARRAVHGSLDCARLSERPPRPYTDGMACVVLPPELESFAAGAVASGRYRDLSEVLAAGVRLLQRQETARAAFVASLEDAEAESERLGFGTLEDIDAEMTGIVGEARRAKA